jgi:MscS family membrane protein
MDYIVDFINGIKNINLEIILNILISIGIIIFFKIISPTLAYIFVRMFNLKLKDKKKIRSNSFYRPLKIFIVILGIYIGLYNLKIPDNMFSVITKFFKICIILLIANGFSGLFNSNSDTYKKVRDRLNFKGNDTVINLVGRIIKIIIYIITGFIVISELGYDLGGLVTGLGISSVVIALAAQDLARNLLGGLSILTDRPFEIGDYIESKDFAGTVEDITFRTTRLRDINNQIVILPNNKLIESYIINGSKKEKRRFNLLITLVLSTSLEKVSNLNTKLKNTLEAHSNIIENSTKVTFSNISVNGIDISISCYADIIDSDEFLKFREELNYTILGIIQEENIRLAYQSQTVYVKNAD